jgi:hypothetical protein
VDLRRSLVIAPCDSVPSCLRGGSFGFTLLHGDANISG